MFADFFQQLLVFQNKNSTHFCIFAIFKGIWTFEFGA